jgi:hypothetical protein
MGAPCSIHGEIRNVNNILVGNLNRKDNSEDLGIDGRIILKWILINMVGGCGLDSCGSE